MLILVLRASQCALAPVVFCKTFTSCLRLLSLTVSSSSSSLHLPDHLPHHACLSQHESCPSALVCTSRTSVSILLSFEPIFQTHLISPCSLSIAVVSDILPSLVVGRLSQPFFLTHRLSLLCEPPHPHTTTLCPPFLAHQLHFRVLDVRNVQTLDRDHLFALIHHHLLTRTSTTLSFRS